MSSPLVKLWLGLILLFVGAYGAYSFHRVYEEARVAHAETPAPTVDESYTPPPAASLDELTFIDARGETFAMADLKGKVWVNGFFFASCPGPCATMNRAVAVLAAELKDKDVRFVSVTVDPKNDTPSVLAKYAESFGADPTQWDFLTGSFEDVQKLGTGVMRVAVGEKMHTERLQLVDRDGKVRATYNATDPLQMAALKKEILKLLAGETPPGDATESPTEPADANKEQAA